MTALMVCDFLRQYIPLLRKSRYHSANQKPWHLPVLQAMAHLCNVFSFLLQTGAPATARLKPSLLDPAMDLPYPRLACLMWGIDAFAGIVPQPNTILGRYTFFLMQHGRSLRPRTDSTAQVVLFKRRSTVCIFAVFFLRRISHSDVRHLDMLKPHSVI